jgi:hypothetical protein
VPLSPFVLAPVLLEPAVALEPPEPPRSELLGASFPPPQLASSSASTHAAVLLNVGP